MMITMDEIKAAIIDEGLNDDELIFAYGVVAVWFKDRSEVPEAELTDMWLAADALERVLFRVRKAQPQPVVAQA